MAAPLAIFVPSLDRPHRLKSLVENIRRTTPEHKIYFVISDDESANILDDLGVSFWRDKGGTWIERNNFLLKETDEPYIFLGSDDLLFHGSWFEDAMKVMGEVDGVVPVNDLNNPHGTSALVSRNYINELSGCVDYKDVIACPEYHHNYADTELFKTAESRKRFAYAEDSVVEHMHWEAKKNSRDDTYNKSLAFSEEDRKTFESRRHLWE